MTPRDTLVSHAIPALVGVLTAPLVGCGPSDADRRPPQAASAGVVPAPPAWARASGEPFVGSGERGNTWPAAVRPWGLVSVGPLSSDTAGYRRDDPTVVGLGHFRVSGSPADFGLLRVVPLDPGDGRDFDATRYHKTWERAAPGWYAVGLREPGAALVACAAARTSVIHIVPAAQRPARVLIDAGHSLGALGNTTSSSALAYAAGEMTGNVTAGAMGGLGTQPTFHVAVTFNRPPSSVQLLTDGQPAEPPYRWRDRRLPTSHAPRGAWREVRGPAARARRVAAVAEFAAPGPDGITLRIGFSPTSIEAARQNARRELPALDVAACAQQASAAWSEVLDRVRVRTPDAGLRAALRAAVYHVAQHPSDWGDVQDTAANAPVTVLSLWDTWRTVHPLHTLLAPDRQRRTAATLVRLAERWGAVPTWEMYGQETNNMSGAPGEVVLAEAALDGLVPDPGSALALLRRNAEQGTRWPAPGVVSKGRLGLPAYLRHGYVPEPPHPATGRSIQDRVAARVLGIPARWLDPAGVYGSVPTTLEYAYNDHCVAELAGRQGDPATAARYGARAQNWRRVFDGSVRDTVGGVVAAGFFRPRHADGSWLTPFAPARGGRRQQRGFVEGDAWQARWFVPHDPAGLAAALGGVPAATATLRAHLDGGAVTLANEPDFVAPWMLMRLGGAEAADQHRIVRLVRRVFLSRPDDLPGDDDAGALSAWLIWTALGLYPIDPCAGTLVLGRPLVEEAELRLGLPGVQAPTLRIEARGASTERAVVTGVRWNGRPIVGAVSVAALRQGGTLSFQFDSTARRGGSHGSARER